MAEQEIRAPQARAKSRPSRAIYAKPPPSAGIVALSTRKLSSSNPPAHARRLAKAALANGNRSLLAKEQTQEHCFCRGQVAREQRHCRNCTRRQKKQCRARTKRRPSPYKFPCYKFLHRSQRGFSPSSRNHASATLARSAAPTGRAFSSRINRELWSPGIDSRSGGRMPSIQNEPGISRR